MTVAAVMKDGSTVQLAAKHGDTLTAVVASLTADSLTGSAVPLADATFDTADGHQLAYRDVDRLEQTDRFGGQP